MGSNVILKWTGVTAGAGGGGGGGGRFREGLTGGLGEGEGSCNLSTIVSESLMVES